MFSEKNPLFLCVLCALSEAGERKAFFSRKGAKGAKKRMLHVPSFQFPVKRRFNLTTSNGFIFVLLRSFLSALRSLLR